MSQIQEGAIGVTIEMALKDDTGAALDITGASTLEFIVERAGAAPVTWTAAVVSAAGGTIKYVTTSAADLTPAGRVRIQPHIVNGSLDARGTVDTFEIMANL